MKSWCGFILSGEYGASQKSRTDIKLEKSYMHINKTECLFQSADFYAIDFAIIQMEW